MDKFQKECLSLVALQNCNIFFVMWQFTYDVMVSDLTCLKISQAS